MAFEKYDRDDQSASFRTRTKTHTVSARATTGVSGAARNWKPLQSSAARKRKRRANANANLSGVRLMSTRQHWLAFSASTTSTDTLRCAGSSMRAMFAPTTKWTLTVSSGKWASRSLRRVATIASIWGQHERGPLSQSLSLRPLPSGMGG